MFADNRSSMVGQSRTGPVPGATDCCQEGNQLSPHGEPGSGVR
jgi:hypothetical protein